MKDFSFFCVGIILFYTCFNITFSRSTSDEILFPANSIQLHNAVYKYIKGERTVQLEVKTSLLHTFNSSYFFSHICLLILFSKCCLCPRGGGFSIYGGVLRRCEPITASQSLCTCVSTLWPEKKATQINTQKNEANRCIMKRCEWAEYTEMCEKHIYATPFFYFHTASKFFEI